MTTATNQANTLQQPQLTGETSTKNKVLGIMAAGAVAVGAAFGPQIADAIEGIFSNAHDNVAALTQAYPNVAEEVVAGKLDPNAVTRIDVGEGGLAYNVASKIETGEASAIDPTDPLIGEVIKQSGATWDNTRIEPHTQVIVNRSDVAGNAPSLAQEAKLGETLTIK